MSPKPTSILKQLQIFAVTNDDKNKKIYSTKHSEKKKKRKKRIRRFSCPKCSRIQSRYGSNSFQHLLQQAWFFYHIRILSLTQLIWGPSKGLCMRSKEVGCRHNGVKTKITKAVTKA